MAVWWMGPSVDPLVGTRLDYWSVRMLVRMLVLISRK